MSFVLIFGTGTALAQTENSTYKMVADQFEYHFNMSSYDSIFNMFSKTMKKGLPANKLAEFLTSLKSQAGNLKEKQFMRYENGTYASYKATFKRARYALNISVDNNSLINGLFLRPFIDSELPVMERNITNIKLPFIDEWTVVWGGDTKEINYHVENEAQKNAFDMVILDSLGNSYKTTGETNNDYYAFGKEIFAPCRGEIVLVVDGIKDNKPGQLNPYYLPGNTVILRTNNDEYLIFGHFKQHSIIVFEGQIVAQDELLGLCGNSGNSSEPHLHFHIQNVEDMNVANGVKCYFEKVIINGTLKKDYSPIQGDKIKNDD